MNNVIHCSLKALSRLEPAELISARAAALRRAEYTFIYASYHPDSNFRRNFASCQDYLAHMRSGLSAAPRIKACIVIREEIAGENSMQNHARVLHRMEMSMPDDSDASYYEAAELSRIKNGWRYLQGYKVPVHELSGIKVRNISYELIVSRGGCF